MTFHQYYATLRVSNFCITMCRMHTCIHKDIHFKNSTLLIPYGNQLALTFSKWYSIKNSRSNYYDVLKITPKATQSQVKKAYYKLSLENHPDQHQGSATATEKFRIITEAYQVLNNVQKRKLYDKGFFHSDVSAKPEEAEVYSKTFTKGRKKPERTPSTGRTPVFNFDAWQSSHYAKMMDDNIKRKAKNVRREEAILMKKVYMNQTRCFFGLIFIMVILSTVYGKSNVYDTPIIKKTTD